MACVNKILHLDKHFLYLFFHRERLVIQCQIMYSDIPNRVQGLQHSLAGHRTQDDVVLHACSENSSVDIYEILKLYTCGLHTFHNYTNRKVVAM